jgi:hypothetical protein
LTNPTAPNGHFQTSSTSNGLLLLLKGDKKPLTDSFSANGVCKIVISSYHFTLDRPCTYCTAVICPPQSRFNKKGRFRRRCSLLTMMRKRTTIDMKSTAVCSEGSYSYVVPVLDSTEITTGVTWREGTTRYRTPCIVNCNKGTPIGIGRSG